MKVQPGTHTFVFTVTDGDGNPFSPAEHEATFGRRFGEKEAIDSVEVETGVIEVEAELTDRGYTYECELTVTDEQGAWQALCKTAQVERCQ